MPLRQSLDHVNKEVRYELAVYYILQTLSALADAGQDPQIIEKAGKMLHPSLVQNALKLPSETLGRLSELANSLDSSRDLKTRFDLFFKAGEKEKIP